MAKNNAKLTDPSLLLQAGIDPRTGLPAKVTNGSPECLKDGLKKVFRIIDEQDAINRYTWYNLPCNLTSQELERLLYYKGQLAFFYSEKLDGFFFMPYALDGTIDFYGRFNTIHPIPMTSGTTETEKKLYAAQESYLSTLKLNCTYGVMNEEELKYEDLIKRCVLLHDYSKQLSQTIIPRQQVNEPLLSVMSEIIPFLRTALITGTGVKGMRVNDADQAHAVETASRTVLNSALTGTPWIGLIGQIEFQELTDGAVIKAQDYMLSLQSLDNLRLGTYGLDNGGLFEKKAQMLQSENAMNAQTTGLVYQDGLSIRQNFCNIVNSIWGIGIWCEPSENVVNQDLNLDGVLYDNNTPDESSPENEGGYADNE